MFVVIMHLRGEQWIRYVNKEFISVYAAQDYVNKNPCVKDTKVVHKMFEHLYTVDFDDV
jgi:hypothetical protein